MICFPKAGSVTSLIGARWLISVTRDSPAPRGKNAWQLAKSTRGAPSLSVVNRLSRDPRHESSPLKVLALGEQSNVSSTVGPPPPQGPGSSPWRQLLVREMLVLSGMPRVPLGPRTGLL